MAGDTGAPGFIPLYDDDTSFAPIQDPFNGISQALNGALKKVGYTTYASYATLILPANVGTVVGQHATVNADSTPVNNGDYTWSGSAWIRSSSGRLGRGRLAANTIVVAANNWTDIATVSATSTGRICTADWAATLYNSNSGSNRTASIRVTCDGTQVEDPFFYDVLLIGTAGAYGVAGSAESTPSAGAHVWKLQANASVFPAVGVRLGATLQITEH